MKKFFSLVLALVMALSLTTVAWGASALPTADAGVITLAANTEYSKIETLDPSVTKIVGAPGATVAGVMLTAAVNDLTFEGVTFTADVGVHNDIDGLTFKDCVFEADAGMYLISNYVTHSYTAKNVTVTGCYFEGACNGTAFLPTATDETAILITSADGDVTVTNNIIDAAAWNGIQVGGSGDFVISGNTISNTGSRSMRLVNNAGELTVTNNTMSNANLAEENDQVFKATGDPAVITAAEAAATGNTYDNVAVELNETGVAATTDGSGKYTSGVIFTDPAGNVAEGYVAVQTGPNAWSIVPANGSTLTSTTYDMVTTDAAATKTVGVTVVTYNAKAPRDTDKNGKMDTLGNIKYVVFSNLPGKYFVQVNRVNDADYTVYQTGTTTLFGYFDEVVYPFYLGNGVAFYNFGEGCGQWDDTPEIGAKYYVFEGNLYKADATETSATNLMVGTTLTPVDLVTPVEWVGHVAKFTYDKNYVVTGVVCAECGTPGVIVPNYMSLPKALQKTGTEGVDFFPVNDDDYYYWLAGPVADTDTETDKDDKVTSAETFDAGIAMYVGMSVMAATGAVVLKKRED